MREITCLTAVVGSGCAGLNAADWLAALGAEDVLLVMDEAYMEFATEPDCCSMVDYMKAHPEKPILVLRTFSKYYAMAGLRVGYALGSEELIGIMRKCSASWNLNVCAQKAAE